MIPKHDRTNFNTLLKAAKVGRVALMEVQRVADGAQVSVICAVNETDEDVQFTPFAVMVEGNPFELFNPPKPGGGFFTQEEAQHA